VLCAQDDYQLSAEHDGESDIPPVVAARGMRRVS
jgi:hypothetical protein